MKIDSLVKSIHSKKEQTELVSRLDQFSQSLFEVKTSVDEKINSIFTFEEQSAVRRFLQENNVHDPMQMQKLISEAKKEINAMPIVILELALDPTPELLAVIHTWFSMSVAPHFIIDIVVNKQLIGALSITVNGKYKDYSVRKQLAGIDLSQMLSV